MLVEAVCPSSKLNQHPALTSAMYLQETALYIYVICLSSFRNYKILVENKSALLPPCGEPALHAVPLGVQAEGSALQSQTSNCSSFLTCKMKNMGPCHLWGSFQTQDSRFFSHLNELDIISQNRNSREIMRLAQILLLHLLEGDGRLRFRKCRLCGNGFRKLFFSKF